MPTGKPIEAPVDSSKPGLNSGNKAKSHEYGGKICREKMGADGVEEGKRGLWECSQNALYTYIKLSERKINY